jgi:hypothetical protein
MTAPPGRGQLSRLLACGRGQPDTVRRPGVDPAGRDQSAASMKSTVPPRTRRVSRPAGLDVTGPAWSAAADHPAQENPEPRLACCPEKSQTERRVPFGYGISNFCRIFMRRAYMHWLMRTCSLHDGLGTSLANGRGFSGLRAAPCGPCSQQGGAAFTMPETLSPRVLPRQ